MTQYLREFYQNWNEKANDIVTDNLGAIYDKYITLYVIYNSLYNQVTEDLRDGGHPIPGRVYDNIAATDYVITYVGADNLLQSLNQNNRQQDVQAVANLIRNKIFYIKLRNGERQRDEDLKILADLESGNNKKKATAILRVLYQVRCNLFHGHKNFLPYQQLLITPLTNILETINRLLFNRLQ